MKRRVLVVDDSAYYRRAIIRILEKDPSVEVVGYARNGRDALKKVKQLNPDVVILDLEMPELDGFSFLRIIMAENPLPVIVVSSLSDDENVYRALEMGAVDFVPKPTKKISPRIYDIGEELLRRVAFADKVNLRTRAEIRRQIGLKVQQGESPPSPKVKPLRPMLELSTTSLIPVAIGASTGGPSALQQVLSGIIYDRNLLVFISQHIPPGFSRALAERLNRYSELDVKEAEHGERIVGGRAYLCPGGYSMMIAGGDEALYVKLEPRGDERYVPSIDKMMISVAEVFGERVMGILLTGMGNDGVKGLASILNAGGRTIAESPETAVIFGMPREAVKYKAVHKIVSLYHIAHEINEWVARWNRKMSQQNLEESDGQRTR